MALGASSKRIDAEAKSTGRARFTADFSLTGMRYAKYIRSTIAHGFVTAIDIEEAKHLPGVEAIFTYQDVPNTAFATAGHAWSLDPQKRDVADRALLTQHIRHFGDGIAIVVAKDQLTANKAAALVKVTYQPYPVITNAESALLSNAPAIHANGNLLKEHQIAINDPETVIQNAQTIVTNHFHTPVVQHCHIESVISYAFMEKHDHITIVSSTQIPHIVRRVVAQALNLSWSNIRVIKPYIGGGFGNKQDVLEEPMAAFLTMKLGGLPVQICLSREECFYASRTRHSFDIKGKIGVDPSGKILGYSLDVLSNTGAYASHGHSIASSGAGKIAHLYPQAAFGYHAITYYSNLPSAGAMRGYGAPQTIFALECLVDDAAHELGIDPVAFRLKNIARSGDINPLTKQTILSAGLADCLEKGKQLFDWDKRYQHYKQQHGKLRHGLGVACFSYGSNTYPVGVEIAGARLLLNQDGTVNLQVGATEIGQGADTIFAQMVAHELSIAYEQVRVISTQDTDITPFDPGAFASRQSYVTAPAIQQACQQLTKKILCFAAQITQLEQTQLMLLNGNIVTINAINKPVISLNEIAMLSYYDMQKGGQLSAEASYKTTSNPPSFGCTFVDLTVDIPLCKVSINRIINIHDSGKILNPQLATGQVQGGLAMGVGWALYEELLFDKHTAVIHNPNLLDYKLPTTLDMPELEAEFIQTYEPQSVFGHKALGEPPIVSPAPAIRNAIRMATGLAINQIPITPKVLYHYFLQAGLL